MKKSKSSLFLGADKVDRDSGQIDYKTMPKFLEPFLVEFLSTAETSFEAIEEKHNVKVLVTKFESAILENLHLGDTCLIETRVELSDTGIIFLQKVTVEEKIVLNCTTIIVLKNDAGRSVKIPDDLKKKLS